MCDLTTTKKRILEYIQIIAFKLIKLKIKNLKKIEFTE